MSYKCREDCVFAASDRSKCRVLVDGSKCEGCSWFTTNQMLFESIERAALLYAKNHHIPLEKARDEVKYWQIYNRYFRVGDGNGS